MQGVVDVTTTGGSYEQLAGNAGSFFISAIISGVVSFFFPENFDFEITRRLNAFQPEDVDAEGHHHTTEPTARLADDASMSEEKKADSTTVGEVGLEKGDGIHVENDVSDEQLYRDFIKSVWVTIGLFGM